MSGTSKLVKKGDSVEIPSDLVENLFEVSLRFQKVVETLEVQLDKEIVHRLKAGEREYRKGKYKVASAQQDIDKNLL